MVVDFLSFQEAPQTLSRDPKQCQLKRPFHAVPNSSMASVAAFGTTEAVASKIGTTWKLLISPIIVVALGLQQKLWDWLKQRARRRRASRFNLDATLRAATPKTPEMLTPDSKGCTAEPVSCKSIESSSQMAAGTPQKASKSARE